MRGSLTFPLVLAAALASQAGEVKKLPRPPKAEWQVIPCDPGTTALGTDAPCRWVLVDDETGAELSPAADGKSAVFTAPHDGQFKVVTYADDGKEVHRLKLVKAGGPPQPMPPGPDPTPPKPPAPADPLVKLLQAAYDLDAREAKAKDADRLDLVELYRQAAVLAATAEVTTTGQLVTKVRDAAKALGVLGLADLRKVVAGELQTAFPEDVQLTAESRKKAAELFARVKAGLEGVK